MKWTLAFPYQSETVHVCVCVSAGAFALRLLKANILLELAGRELPAGRKPVTNLLALVEPYPYASQVSLLGPNLRSIFLTYSHPIQHARRSRNDKDVWSCANSRMSTVEILSVITVA